MSRRSEVRIQQRDHQYLTQSVNLARQGHGYVEPNPQVGCLLVRGGEVVGTGWHERFGASHAEVNALRAAGERSQGATAYITLEPCCHQGKTPPCTSALIQAGIARVVVGCQDPNPQVAGQGIDQLRTAGLSVEVCDHPGCQLLIAPFAKWITQKKPWVIAKWAMTLDGKLATRTGNSQWISCSAARKLVHHLRGRVDAVLVGLGTAQADDPLLTARPPGPRTATRIVLDTHAQLSPQSRLVQQVEDAPVLLVVGDHAPPDRLARLNSAGIEVLSLPANEFPQRIESLLAELGQRPMTNLLVEGGATVLGAFFDAQAIDEVHAFVAPKLVGGSDAPPPLAGIGVEQMLQACQLNHVEIEVLEQDVHVHGFVGPV